MEFMDGFTEESLDFQYILNRINIKTPYGKIYKDRMRPFLIGEEEKLIEELEKIETYTNYAKDQNFMRELNNIFHGIKDLRNSINRAREGGILSEVELFEIKNFLFLIRALKKFLTTNQTPLWGDMVIEPIESLEKLLDPESTGISTFYIYDAYSEELKSIREEKREGERAIKREKKNLKEKIQKELDIKLNPDGSIIIPKDRVELIEKLEDYPHLNYISETYMNIKYSLKPTDTINLLERKVLILKDKEEKEEMEIRKYLSKEIGKKSKALYKNISSIGKIDFILGKASFGVEIDGVKPRIIKDHSIALVEGRHPKVEESLKEIGLKYTPITLELKEGVTCITGANMGGKTVSLKLVGLLTAMAQYGLLVPAKEMILGLNNFIKASIGDLQSTDKGLSTFGGEIKLIQEAIEMAENKGLILIDELASGTNPEEGYAISKAVVEYLLDKDSITLLTTHYDNIGSMDRVVHLQVIGLSHMELEELKKELENIQLEKIDLINRLMDYRLRTVDKTKPVPKDALNIARIMGLDQRIIHRAEKSLED
ncbi:MutS domain V protein [[Clostridium] ultunense Esp]|uniref:MutS domain V protein n=1 Tax=[Clostridium] ultunense Esp TaxID=1288971 RepID=M1Z5C9_9FIRM|nr:MutS domain V protein [Schnuerera ultunensis]CCQ92733.1 MutS domain V protein [[Clostridium] ultunense Esp]SHD76211.1 MutS domain V protein [[Clostridium] ultunense Esp]